jgi:hypothetical protein
LFGFVSRDTHTVVADTRLDGSRIVLNRYESVILLLARRLRFRSQAHDNAGRNAMETFVNLMTVLGGASLSLGIGLLLEELIFGKVFCRVFARQAARVKSSQKQ